MALNGLYCADVPLSNYSLTDICRQCTNAALPTCSFYFLEIPVTFEERMTWYGEFLFNYSEAVCEYKILPKAYHLEILVLSGTRVTPCNKHLISTTDVRSFQ